jgi:hypothetical protein
MAEPSQFTPAAERVRLATRAASEIEALATLLRNQTRDDPEGAAWRSILRRISRLACVQLSALDDEVDTVESITARFDESEQ